MGNHLSVCLSILLHLVPKMIFYDEKMCFICNLVVVGHEASILICQFIAMYNGTLRNHWRTSVEATNYLHMILLKKKIDLKKNNFYRGMKHTVIFFSFRTLEFWWGFLLKHCVQASVFPLFFSGCVRSSKALIPISILFCSSGVMDTLNFVEGFTLEGIWLCDHVFEFIMSTILCSSHV